MVNNLDSPSHDVRIDAIKHFQKCDRLVIEYLEFESQHHKKLQVRKSCQRIVNYFYRGNNLDQNTISIWMLPKRYRYKNGVDISEYYYERAELFLILDDQNVDENDYGNEDVEKLAMYWYMQDSMKNLGRDDALGIYREAIVFSDKFENYKIANAEGDWWYTYRTSPPEAIEDIIENKK